MFSVRCKVICLSCWLLVGACAGVATAEDVEFAADIRPVLAARCGKCHGENVHKGDLDLSSIAGIRRGGESGESLVAATLDDSLLWNMIDGGDMPPEGEPPLSDAERNVIRRWLESGAAEKSLGDGEPETIHQHQVLPIVLLRCTACHGPRLQQGGLDLRSRASMLAGGESGPAMIPGDADASLMIKRVESEACPPRDQLLKFFVRRPPESEIDILRRWIDAGAPEADMAPDVATTEPDPLVTDADRQHWAYQPMTAPTTDSNGKMLDIDDFVRRRLQQVDLELSPPADRDTLIRRVHLDLIGLPPSGEQWRRWREDPSDDWYRDMVDELLASPRYGERWGRYWLDLAGYADSEGGVSSDPIRSVAWKYRDYVIRSFNEDKPYDRFLIEQLAGDELLDYEAADEITDEMVENLIATGFLRMGIDETGSRTMNFVPERLKVISDAIHVVSAGLMGMTMECARCHSHKYDAIPHRDYYRFKAIFQGALDEHDWSTFKNRRLEVATAEHRRRVAEVNPALSQRVKQLTAQLKQTERDIQFALLRHYYPDQSEEDHQATVAALKVADNNRSLRQRRLVERLQKAEVIPMNEHPAEILALYETAHATQREIDLTRRRMVPDLTIRALWDFGRPSPTYILRRGEHDKPGRLVGPGVPSVLTDGKTPFVVEPPFPDGTAKTGRRLAFARWLTSPDHPLTARVMVNRIWYHHFGVGLVKEIDNFGVQGEPPSHPQLLDWLALRFVENGWSIKHVHRLVLNSATYKQSSRVSDERLQRDPDNRLLSRMPLRRMDAEALRDSLLFVAGRLDATAGGLPDTVTVRHDGLVRVNPTEQGNWRRSVYLQYRRTEIPSMMATFDYPKMGPNCLTRSVSTVSLQALMLKNDAHVRELAASFAERVAAEVQVAVAAHPQDRHSITVRSVYGLALNRLPDEQELALGSAALTRLEAAWDDDKAAALETYCHTILNSAAFLYVD